MAWNSDWPGTVAGTPGTVPHFKRWASELVFEDGRRHPPEAWQLAFVRDLFGPFDECWLIVPQGNSKTSLCAALALYHMETAEAPWVPIAAYSRDGAEILFGQARGFIERTPGLRYDRDADEWPLGLDVPPGERGSSAGPFEVKGRREISHRYNGGAGLKVYAADKETADGVIPTLPIVDEGHRHKDLGLYRLWRGKLNKRGGKIVMISTAGEPGGDFEKTRDALRDQATDRSSRGECHGRYATASTVMHEYAVPRRSMVEDIATVKAANPLKKITFTSLMKARRSPTLDYGEDWLRLTCNIAARSSRAAINETDWDEAELAPGRSDDAPLGVIPEGVPVTVGADFAWSVDTTSLVPLWVPRKDFRLAGPPEILVPPEDGSMLDVLTVHEAFERIHARNPIEMIVADKTKAQDTLMWAENEFGCEVIDRPQTNSLAGEDYANFMSALRGGAAGDEAKRAPWLWHTGDPGLRAHVMNAIAYRLPGDRYKFDRPTQSRGNRGRQDVRVIDALVALGMANTEAATRVGREPPRPLIAVVGRR